MKLNLICLFLVALFILPKAYAEDIETLREDIYSKIHDKHCINHPLNKCNCREAQAMKAYISALLEVEIPKEEIFYKVAKKYSLRVINHHPTKISIEKRLIDDANGKFSRMDMEPATFDFGKISRKEGKLSKVIKLHNQGTTDLVIKNIRVSCGCVSASLKVGNKSSSYFGTRGAKSGWQETIVPGAYGNLDIMLDLAHASMGMGHQRREIFISSNDAFNPENSILVTIEVSN